MAGLHGDFRRDPGYDTYFFTNRTTYEEKKAYDNWKKNAFDDRAEGRLNQIKEAYADYLTSLEY